MEISTVDPKSATGGNRPYVEETKNGLEAHSDTGRYKQLNKGSMSTEQNKQSTQCLFLWKPQKEEKEQQQPVNILVFATGSKLLNHSMMWDRCCGKEIQNKHQAGKGNRDQHDTAL